MSESNDLYEQNLEWYAPNVEVLDAEFRAYKILSRTNFEIVSDEETESY